MLERISAPIVQSTRSSDSAEGILRNNAVSCALDKVINAPGSFQVNPALKRASVDDLCLKRSTDFVRPQDASPDLRFYPKSIEHYDLAELRCAPKNRYELASKTVAKYDDPNIALIDRSALDRRHASYSNVSIVPNFLHNFFVLDGDSKSKSFIKSSEQFVGTEFHEKLGGFLTMPNKYYVPGDEEAYVDPATINQKLKDKGGFALVSYWVPPQAYEGLPRFNKVFNDSAVCRQEAPVNLSLEAYKKETGLHHITTPLEVRKEHLSLLENLKAQILLHLNDCYNVSTDKGNDKVDFYFHSPLHADSTAGLHLHTRVNQAIHAGEFDTQRLGLDDLLAILRDENIAGEQVKEQILNITTKTSSGKFFTMSPVWGPDQFEKHNIEFEVVPNPWKRPSSDKVG